LTDWLAEMMYRDFEKANKIAANLFGEGNQDCGSTRLSIYSQCRLKLPLRQFTATDQICSIQTRMNQSTWN
jgi:hypothetical protein